MRIIALATVKAFLDAKPAHARPRHRSPPETGGDVPSPAESKAAEEEGAQEIDLIGPQGWSAGRFIISFGDFFVVKEGTRGYAV